MTPREVFDRLQAHARKNYSRRGWDSVVECVGFEDFERDVAAGYLKPTVRDAVRFYGAGARAWDERRREVEAERF